MLLFCQAVETDSGKNFRDKNSSRWQYVPFLANTEFSFLFLKWNLQSISTYSFDGQFWDAAGSASWSCFSIFLCHLHFAFCCLLSCVCMLVPILSICVGTGRFLPSHPMILSHMLLTYVAVYEIISVIHRTQFLSLCKQLGLFKSLYRLYCVSSHLQSL